MVMEKTRKLFVNPSQRIIEGRYVLMNSLSASAAMGELCQGRDVDSVTPDGLETRVLIHIVPSALLGRLDAATAFHVLRFGLSRHVRSGQVLTVKAYGDYQDDSCYFVLESPPEYTLLPLNAQPELSKRCKKSLAALHTLLDVPANHAVNPALVLTTNTGNLYVAGTVLLAGLGIVPHTSSPAVAAAGRSGLFSRRQLGFTGLLSLSVVAAAGAFSVYYASHKPANTLSVRLPAVNATVFPLGEPLNLTLRDQGLPAFSPAVPVLPLHTEALPLTATVPPAGTKAAESGLTVPVSVARPTASATASRQEKETPADKSHPFYTSGMTKPGNPLLSDKEGKGGGKADEALRAVAAPSVKAEEPAAAQGEHREKSAATLAHTTSTRTAVATELPAKNAADAPASETVLSQQANGGTTQSEETIPSGHSVDQLAQAGHEALSRLDLEQALALARQLRQQAPLHTKTRRLGREVASAYHERARRLLVVGDADGVKQALDSAKNVMMEFNLAEMNAAHDVLMHKWGHL